MSKHSNNIRQHFLWMRAFFLRVRFAQESKYLTITGEVQFSEIGNPKIVYQLIKLIAWRCADVTICTIRFYALLCMWPITS